MTKHRMTEEQMRTLAEAMGTTLEELFEHNPIFDGLVWEEVSSDALGPDAQFVLVYRGSQEAVQ